MVEEEKKEGRDEARASRDFFPTPSSTKSKAKSISSKKSGYIDDSPRAQPGRPQLDTVDMTTKWRCVTLTSRGTIASASSDGFFYLSRGVNPGYRCEYSFKIKTSIKMNIFIGV